mmetsp:Transcript_12980/g.35939  ORF Transcript_12980/g.35939 Transcript_12980/m.35939 type:complete len:104 (+) Transcript_12980:1255-1566(+)
MIGETPGPKRPGRSSRPTMSIPPPPCKPTAKYLADALTYCWSPVTVERRNSVKHSSGLGWSQNTWRYLEVRSLKPLILLQFFQTGVGCRWSGGGEIAETDFLS